MVQQTLNPPPRATMPFNTGDSTEYGDNPATIINKLNAMMTDLYDAVEQVNGGVTAYSTGGQTNATPLTYGINRITTVAAIGDSVKLPVAVAGTRCVVINATTNAMQVYGDHGSSDTINGTANATGVSQAGRSVCTYTCGAAGLWETNDTGDGFYGNYSTVSVVNGLTAHSGGGQASAVLLSATISRVTTVAAGNDSVLLPPAIHGMQITIINAAAANSMNVFPASATQGGVSGGDAINALSQNSAFAVAAGKIALATCAVDGIWHIILSA